jgi:anaerobic magnesium-protoporphyrin IX monomethyl ester cyclase
VILMASRATEEQIEKLRAAGCVYARIALDAGSAARRAPRTHGPFLEVAGWVKRHGIRLGSLNALGGPGSTLEGRVGRA